jgi:hypothetical protein
MNQDRLTTVIFEAVKREPATAEERRRAIVRAGLIAQAYICELELTNAVLGSQDVLDNNRDLDLG